MSHYWGNTPLNNYEITGPTQLLAITQRAPGRVILRFHRPTCPACQHMNGTWMDMCQRPEYKSRVVFVSINVEDNQVLAQHYKLTKIPTFVCVENNVPVSSFSGADPVALRRLIETGKA